MQNERKHLPGTNLRPLDARAGKAKLGFYIALNTEENKLRGKLDEQCQGSGTKSDFFN